MADRHGLQLRFAEGSVAGFPQRDGELATIVVEDVLRADPVGTPGGSVHLEQEALRRQFLLDRLVREPLGSPDVEQAEDRTAQRVYGVGPADGCDGSGEIGQRDSTSRKVASAR